MSDFTEQLDAFNKQVTDMVDLSVKDKEKIAKVGAQVFKNELKKTVKDRHYRIRTTGKNPHLGDSIMIKAGNRDGKRLGAYTVGWKDDKVHIANFIENGTRIPYIGRSKSGKKFRYDSAGQVGVRKDPFITETRQDNQTNKAMIEAERQAYHEIMQGKN